MAQKRSTKKTKKTTLRKCSVCRVPGHTKRTCADTPHAASKPKKPKFIFVNTHKGAPSSEHVVDLKKDQSGDWRSVSAYKEETKKEKRVMVDFADLVRAANLKKKSAHPNIEAFRKSLQDIQFRHTKKRTAVAPKKKPSKVITIVRGVRYKVEDAAQETQKQVRAYMTALKISKRVATYVMAALVVIAVLPFPARSIYNHVSNDTAYVVERSTNAFMSLQSSTVAALSNNIYQAQFDLNEALGAFSDAQSLLDREYRALTYVASMLPVVGKRIEGRQDILVAGHHIALGNTYLVKGIDEATKNKDMNNTERLSVLKTHIRSSIPQYKEALERIAGLEPSFLPIEYQKSFVDFRLLYTAFIDDMEDLVDVIDGLETVLGSRDFKRYLVMFQNNHELRATGGFTGSYALLDVQKGKILNIDVPGGGTYDVQGQLDIFVRPPLPLQLANKRWEFQDVNWFAHFPASAAKTADFFRHARGTTVDGVISINASVLERLLGVLGPLYNSEFDVLLDAEGALANLQQQVEVDYDKDQNEPKAVLSAVLDQMFSSLGNVDPKQLLALLIETHQAMQEKEIQVYFEDEQAQKKFRSFGWTGELHPSPQTQDYLMVVNTNIGGQKSDARVEQRVQHQAVIQDDGSIIDTVVIERDHVGAEGEAFYGNQNINYVRVHVPEGSELLDAGGFSFPQEESFMVPEYWYEDDADLAAITQTEVIDAGTGTRITEQFGKTVFGNWVVTEPGSTSKMYFTYRLPFTLDDLSTTRSESTPRLAAILDRFNVEEQNTTSHYSLFAQKQSGTYGDFESQIIYPDAWRPVWRTDDEVQVTINGGVFADRFDTDKAYGIVMQSVE